MNLEKLSYKQILFLFYATSTYFFFYHYYGQSLLIAFLIIQLLLMLSHYQIVNTEPGPIKLKQTPIEIIQNNNLPSNFIIENEIQLQNKCKKCNMNWKPPKTHHCQTCNKCIHYRDHHCVWFNCCVGYKNLKYFCQFLIYFSIITLIHGITSVYKLLSMIYQFNQQGYINLQWSFIYNFLSFDFILILIQLLISFVGYKISNILLKDKFVQLPDLTTYHGQKGERYMYYKDFKSKLTRLLSKNILLWILPLPNKFNLNYLELTYPKVTAGKELLDYYLDQKDKDYPLYKIFEIND